ncbi:MULTISPECIES: hypothetical protein [Oceanobacillus]|uniref:Phage protein n=1 Tax=Oceanobacillus neutriphilus TaxID=531815 RepID=A0ABQ2NYB3_9BACI|nr:MULTISPECIES: hypothetical protein [Oceanobacillus]GGP13556.1 hypothetical protein GCM10011346_34020 [Oceanobacillus neutriphilus]
MAKVYRVKTKAVFNGEPVGTTLEMDETLASKYEALKYLEIIEEVKPKRKPAQKKPAQAKGKQVEATTEAKPKE